MCIRDRSISGEAVLAAAGLSVDFEAASFDSDVVNLVANAGQDDSSCMELIDASQAVAHLQSTLDALNDQTEPPIGGGLAGKVGIWEGVGQQQGISWTIRADLQLDEQLIEYPSLNCGGFWELIEETEAQLSFRETITFGNNMCVDQGLVELTDQSENELVYRYYFPDGAGGFQDEVGAIGNLARTQ